MWSEYINATSVDEVLQVLAEKGGSARIVAGATDLILEMERGTRKGIETLIDISRIPHMDDIALDEERIIHIGPLVTHNHCVGSKLIRDHAFPLARAAWEVGSPQIRNRGTIAGNLITASPANDTITPLMALNARVTLRSQRGDRSVALRDFYIGVRRTVMADDEMLVDIVFPALNANQRGTFMKFALRRAQAISLVNTAVVITYEDSLVREASITLGAVAPTIVHASRAEEHLVGRILDESSAREAAELAVEAARPISDVRSSSSYRNSMIRVMTLRALRAIAQNNERQGFPEKPVLLRGATPQNGNQANKTTPELLTSGTIVTHINGKEYRLPFGSGKTLLHLLREDAGLIGPKEGCAEGECGACTVFLDGIAVMACLVPAPRAHGAEIITIEGLAQGKQLHPVQEAFIQEGAVQCGYCTPGFIMSAVKLLEENPRPDRDAIRQAITGNLCRCTGYYKIIDAIERASIKLDSQE